MRNTFWKVGETVGGGRFFTWDGSWPTRAAAEAAIEKQAPGAWARAQEYRTGSGFGTGPERVEEESR